MICPNCGKEIDDDSTFCVYCGKKVEVQNNGEMTFSSSSDEAHYSPSSKSHIQFGKQEQAYANGTVTLQKSNFNRTMIIIAIAIAVAAFLFAWFLFASPKTRAAKQLDIGEQYLKEKKYEDAIVAFNASIKIDKKNIKPYEGLVVAHTKLQQYDEAADAMEQAITNIGLENIPDKDITNLVDVYTVVATNAENDGDTDKAKQCYERILELQPDNETAMEKNADINIISFDEKLRKDKGDLNGKTVELLYQGTVENNLSVQQSETKDGATGIISVTPYDFDNDNEKEILVVSQEATESKDFPSYYEYNIIVSMYENNGDSFKQKDSFTIGNYFDYGENLDIKISYKTTNSGSIIFFDDQDDSLFGDGFGQKFNIVSYDGNLLSSIYQDSYAGSDFSFDETDTFPAIITKLNSAGISCTYMPESMDSLTNQDTDLITIAEIKNKLNDAFDIDTNNTNVYAYKTYTDLTSDVADASNVHAIGNPKLIQYSGKKLSVIQPNLRKKDDGYYYLFSDNDPPSLYDMDGNSVIDIHEEGIPVAPGAKISIITSGEVVIPDDNVGDSDLYLKYDQTDYDFYDDIDGIFSKKYLYYDGDIMGATIPNFDATGDGVSRESINAEDQLGFTLTIDSNGAISNISEYLMM